MSNRFNDALDSLEGLSVGDAFGEQFFIANATEAIAARRVRAGTWRYTDDTQMALSVVSVLRQCGEIRQEPLAAGFGARYDMTRGYGPAMHELVPRLGRETRDWRRLSRSLFGGRGSFGNGGAMRVAPLGAYFADDLVAVADNAARATEVTHSHPEAIAGATAIAVATAIATTSRDTGLPGREMFLRQVATHLPESEVKRRTVAAANMPDNTTVLGAVAQLGNGSDITAMDTVPFALWCAATSLSDYEEALWLTVSGLGDRDTTCAMVGGIVSAYTGLDAIPTAWRAAREPLPKWHLDNL